MVIRQNTIQESSIVDKISDVGMYAASKADEITWQTLWLACKYEVAKSGIKPSDSKFMDEVNHKFQEVIYRTQVVDGGYTKERAKELVYNWGSIPETGTLEQEGFAVNELGNAYLDGDVSLSTVRSMYIKYGGYTAEEAEEETTVLEFVKQNPACDGISYAAVSGYNDYCKKTGVDPATFYDAWKFKNGAKNDYDSDGEVTISKKEKVMDYIDGLNLTKSQKDSLYYACGYAESKLDEAPWH